LLRDLKLNLKKKKKTNEPHKREQMGTLFYYAKGTRTIIDMNWNFFSVGRFSGSSQTKQFEFRDMHTGFLFSVRSTDVVAK